MQPRAQPVRVGSLYKCRPGQSSLIDAETSSAGKAKQSRSPLQGTAETQSRTGRPLSLVRMRIAAQGAKQAAKQRSTTAQSRAAFTSSGRQSTAAMEGRADAEQQAAARIETGSRGRPKKGRRKGAKDAAGQMYRKQAKSPGKSPGRAKEAKHGRQPEAQKRRRKPGRPTAARKGCTCSDSFALC